MAITVNWTTKVIDVPQADLTLISPGLYELDVNAFRLTLKDLEDGDGMPFLDTHRHNTEVTLAGTTFARTFEIINGYTITFEDGQYSVRLAGANNNILDVKNVNQVSLISQNSAGLITVTTGSGLSAAQDTKLTEMHGELRSIESGFHHSWIMRVLLSALAGKLSGAATTSVAIRDYSDTKDRISATVDEHGNRTSVTLDGS